MGVCVVPLFKVRLIADGLVANPSLKLAVTDRFRVPSTKYWLGSVKVKGGSKAVATYSESR